MTLKIGKEIPEVNNEARVQCNPFFSSETWNFGKELHPIGEGEPSTILIPEASLKVLSVSELNEEAINNNRISKDT